MKHLFCPAGRPGTGQSQKIPARPVPWQDFELVPLSRDVPGQTGTGSPAVPLSQAKAVFLVPVSLCPGTRAWSNVPGQNQGKTEEKSRENQGKTGGKGENQWKTGGKISKNIFLFFFY